MVALKSYLVVNYLKGISMQRGAVFLLVLCSLLFGGGAFAQAPREECISTAVGDMAINIHELDHSMPFILIGPCISKTCRLQLKIGDASIKTFTTSDGRNISVCRSYRQFKVDEIGDGCGGRYQEVAIGIEYLKEDGSVGSFRVTAQWIADPPGSTGKCLSTSVDPYDQMGPNQVMQPKKKWLIGEYLITLFSF